jgi:Flp pilus assembly protein TadB
MFLPFGSDWTAAQRIRYGVIWLATMLLAVIVVNVPNAGYVVGVIAIVAAAFWILRREQKKQL